MMTTSSDSTEGGPIFFFREHEISYGFLSHRYNSPFTAPAPASANCKTPMTFVAAEQYMMHFKAIVLKDQEIADKMLLEGDPREQKSLGRKVKGFNDEIWDQHREEIVEGKKWWKFNSDRRKSFLKKLPLETGDRPLVGIWGIGYDAANAEANMDIWGENLLGKALMRMRDRLQAEEVNGKDVTERPKARS